MIKLLVSIVNYNSYKDTLKVVDDIKNAIDTNDFSISFFIVDNSVERFEFDHFQAQLDSYTVSYDVSDAVIGDNILVSENNGFGAANNLVFDYAEDKGEFDWIWLVNNDIELDPSVLSSLKPYMNKKHPILGSVIYEDHGPVVGTIGIGKFKGYGSPGPVQHLDDIYKVDAVNGTSMFVRVDSLNGLRFDENYFMYVEENDFCYRAKEIGMESYIVKSSVLSHYSGKTFGSRQALRWYYKVRNLLYLKKKLGHSTFALSLFLGVVTIKNYPINFCYIKAWFVAVLDFRDGRMGKTKREIL
ncbi:glycosyltransferase family 2 protein [Vibrio coralliilyticus]|uniref:glycosyltransferase family 2 protein n=1 Tax=Vibrio coralliilyticus TaxID=190893 RepID=UPI003916D4B0